MKVTTEKKLHLTEDHLIQYERVSPDYVRELERRLSLLEYIVKSRKDQEGGGAALFVIWAIVIIGIPVVVVAFLKVWKVIHALQGAAQ